MTTIIIILISIIGFLLTTLIGLNRKYKDLYEIALVMNDLIKDQNKKKGVKNIEIETD